MLRNTVRKLLSLNPRAVLLVIVLSVGVLGGLSWCVVTALDYVDTLSRAAQDTRQTVALLEGHAHTVLQPGVQMLERAAGRLQGHGVATLAESALHETLVAPTGALAVADAQGRIVLGAPVVPNGHGGRLADALRAAGDGSGLLAVAGQVDGTEVLLIGQHVRDAENHTDGTVLVALPVSALSPVLDALDGQQGWAGLYRADGTLLAGDGAPALGPLPMDGAGTGMAESRTIGGQDHILAWRRLSGLPVLAAVALPRNAVFGPWRIRLERGALVAGAGAVALIGLAVLGWGSLRRETLAMRALAEANARLEQGVEARTADLRALNHELVAALAEKEHANQAKARFLSAANHDLRQPFQALRLFHHLLSERLKDPRDRSIAEKMGEALDSGETLLHALLEVATLDAGVVRPNIGIVPVEPLLEEVAAEFRAAAELKGLDLCVRACACAVRSDPVLLKRMLRDIVGNAVSYTGDGGILIGCRQRGQWLRMEVWDTGPGIPPEHLDSIFEDFVQLGNPERDRSRGLGLGLAKVRRKAALLGHAVDVRSRPGLGSVFAIAAPIAVAEVAADGGAACSGADSRPAAERLILVVEDDAVQRTGVQMLLEGWGHAVVTAADGPSAIERVRSARRVPDVIVTDFRLPGPLTGAQVVTRAGETAGRPIPGIILTGDTAPERIRDAVATGCRLLHKPFSPELLRDALAAVSAADTAQAVREGRRTVAA